jgi:hypothetical protein
MKMNTKKILGEMNYGENKGILPMNVRVSDQLLN